jgi:glycosyltransferase involved in cell wall biosynthesis
MSTPLVSVLIDTYNHERFIEQAIVSVLEQDVSPAEMEVIVVDDGSTDSTPAIVHKFIPQVRYLRKANGGQASAFNVGIPETHGEIVAFLDGDDWWAPTKLRKVVEALATDSQVGIVGHGITEVFQNGSQRAELLREIPRFRVNSLEGALVFRLRKSFLGTSRMTIRKELLRQILPVPEDLSIEADEYLFTLSAVLADALILPEALTYYRLHGANLYQMSGFLESNVRRKQNVLASLSKALSEQLQVRGLSPQIVRAVTAEIQAESDQLRLSLDGGYPWETVRTELSLYEIPHGEASHLQRTFKYLSLLPALVLPSRVYYRLKRQLAQNKLYLRARAKWVPIPQPGHVERHRSVS